MKNAIQFYYYFIISIISIISLIKKSSATFDMNKL